MTATLKRKISDDIASSPTSDDNKTSMRVLVAEDAANIRFGLTRLLRKWGYEVFGAADGEEAWDILNEHVIHIVISDWMMPRCNGVELCTRIREHQSDRYTYFILLTSRDDDGALVEGMTAGADDYLVKPFVRDELQVRIKAGERIIRLEQALEAKNRDLSNLNGALSSAYQTMEDDLKAAADIQLSLLPEKSVEANSLGFDWMFLPCAVVGGDLLNFVDLGSGQTLFYNFDVSGHGVQAAMLSVSISKMLDVEFCRKHGLTRDEFAFDAGDIVAALNERFQTSGSDSRYFTIALGVYDSATSSLSLCQAGHTHPVHVDRAGSVQELGNGGFPVGMLPAMEYESISIELKPGDRVFLHSDGITECENSEGEQFGSHRLQSILANSTQSTLSSALEQLQHSIFSWQGSPNFEDDVSLLGIEYR